MFPNNLPDPNRYAPHERALRTFDENATQPDGTEAEAVFARFRTLVDGDVQAVRQRLFESGPASKDSEDSACRWIAAQHRRLARAAGRVAATFARSAPAGDRTLRMLLVTLNYLGESAKSPSMEGRLHAGLNSTMVLALASGRWAEESTLEIDGASVPCSASSLFFRGALLARFAGGGLTVRQMEIFDAWLWIWAPALRGSQAPLGEGAWRVDLDSVEGLKRGERVGTGPALYLAQAPLETARLSVVASFHCDRVVPEAGPASRFAIDEYVTVLDALEATFRQFRSAAPMRATRREARVPAELHVGLAEVRDKGLAADGICDIPRRVVQVINVSDTGLAFEAVEADCSDVALDDLVSLRVSPSKPVLVGKVVRRLRADASGQVVVGVRIMSRNAKAVRVRPASDDLAALPHITLLHLAGEDDSGLDDSYLSNEADGRRSDLLEATVGGDTFTFRLNHAQERGRGWVRSGFELASTA